MPHESSNTTAAARQVELAVGRLDSLSTLPCVIARIISRLLEGPFSPSALAEVIESDPALTSRMLWLLGREGIQLSSRDFSLGPALDRLGPEVVRDTLLSVKVVAEPHHGAATSRKDLLLHSQAVALCAESLARLAEAGVVPSLAYTAGLLHDIGKFALSDAMPKSFARIVEQARAAGTCARSIEQQHLGVDHAILGRRLAQKWRLPEPIIMAIWLHHGDTAIISSALPGAKLAQIVQLADLLARQSGIGQSGSYGRIESIEARAETLGLKAEQLGQIVQDLLGRIGELSNRLGVDSPHALADYGTAAHTAAAQLARQQTELSAENQRLQGASSHLDFATDFLLSVDGTAEAIDVAESFAIRWQKFYQTGSVFLYLAPEPGAERLEAVVVEGLGHCRVVCLECPAGTRCIPEAISDNFAVLEAHDHIGWMFEQIDVEFGIGRTKLVPLLSGRIAVGAIAFELNYPGDAALFVERFGISAGIAGAVLSMALSRDRGSRLAERFSQLVGGPTPVRSIPAGPAEATQCRGGPVEALAEMAAGAAHELNNPLAVVSGRAQLLAEAEVDPEKKELLKQIHQNACEAAAIVEQLMDFAEPPPPRATIAEVRQMLGEAVELAARKTGLGHANVQVEVGNGAEKVFVDSAQVASAVANIVANAIESYREKLGPVKVTAEAEPSGEFVQLKVMDLGCGMDEQTASKCTQPFFSARPAGRKRGMGLAQAARFVEINGGTIELQSEPGRGTTVTVRLPVG